MSITFSVGTPILAKLTNEYYDFNSLEDAVFNTKEHLVELTPNLNMTNGNAFEFMRMLALPQEYSGIIQPGDIYAFHSMVVTLHRKARYSRTVEERILRYYLEMERISAYALATEDSIIWG
jgi:hypothetical protein